MRDLKLEATEVVAVGPGDTDSLIHSSIGVVMLISEIAWKELEIKVIDIDGESAFLIILERVECCETAELGAAVRIRDATGAGVEIDVLGLGPGGSKGGGGDG